MLTTFVILKEELEKHSKASAILFEMQLLMI
jgi:hypothetical protein